MHPPHQPKPNESGRKITLKFGEDLFFFGDHLILGVKTVWISDFGQKITLNFGEDIRIFEVLCLKSPPPKFSRSATGWVVLLKESNWSPETRKNFAVSSRTWVHFFKSPSCEDVEVKSSLSSSLTLRVVEDDSNLILMVTLKSVGRRGGRGQYELSQY